LLEFRASFLPAYQEVVERIRVGLGLAPTGRPEKTPESIIAKLQRSDTKLSRMQDIAGCRIVVDARWHLDTAVKALHSLFETARVVDRRQQPSFGYRAVHVIVRVQGRQVEVQVRAALQDQWANLVEAFSDIQGVDFKHGQEAPDGSTLQWLMLGSDCIDRLDREEDTQFLPKMDPNELSWFRRGQFTATMFLATYIRPVSE
jgi:putative GTP pyrophosphokinase